jgi:ABC-type phosphate/phosphonate transport system permease subunit
MRRFLPRPSYVLIFILCAFAYAGALFPALVAAGLFLWVFGPSLVIGQVVRDIHHIARARPRR